jgi:ferrous iron transport protein A
LRLSDLHIGDCGIVVGIVPAGQNAAGELNHEELERRLLEIGFVEGARFRILHEGLIGRDPMAIKLDDMRIALRRREAEAVAVEREGAGRP